MTLFLRSAEIRAAEMKIAAAPMTIHDPTGRLKPKLRSIPRIEAMAPIKEDVKICFLKLSEIWRDDADGMKSREKTRNPPVILKVKTITIPANAVKR